MSAAGSKFGLLTVAFVLTVAVGQPPNAAAARCGQAAAKTVVQSPRARVFVRGSGLHKRYLGCLRNGSRSWSLTAPQVKDLFPILRENLTDFALNAAWAGYSWDVQSTDTNRGGVAIRNLSSGSKRATAALVGHKWSWERVNRLAINAQGDIAWVGDGWRSGIPITPPQDRQILVLDGNREAQVLDEGLDIVPDSVRIGLSAVRWNDSEGPHHFLLP
jgi:hypothetical protein